MSLFVFRLHHRVGILERQMADVITEVNKVKADLAAVQADLSAAKAGVGALQSSVTALKQIVTDLQTQLGSATLSPDAQAALDALVAQADATKTQADDLAATVGPQPGPTPA